MDAVFVNHDGSGRIDIKLAKSLEPYGIKVT
jgi:hypothetical protein